MGDGEADHLVLLADQVDDGPVGEAGHNQIDQVAQRLVDVQRGSEQSAGIGEQRKPFQLRKPPGDRRPLGRLPGTSCGVKEDERGGRPEADAAGSGQP
jgi:hypothetical protein